MKRRVLAAAGACFGAGDVFSSGFGTSAADAFSSLGDAFGARVGTSAGDGFGGGDGIDGGGAE